MGRVRGVQTRHTRDCAKRLSPAGQGRGKKLGMVGRSCNDTTLQ